MKDLPDNKKMWICMIDTNFIWMSCNDILFFDTIYSLWSINLLLIEIIFIWFMVYFSSFIVISSLLLFLLVRFTNDLDDTWPDIVVWRFRDEEDIFRGANKIVRVEELYLKYCLFHSFCTYFSIWNCEKHMI